ncbi:hypothetical protein [Poseidonocella sp. HB161398]|nr:hypothetical protein [Poseidonocella sp. HB161398]
MKLPVLFLALAAALATPAPGRAEVECPSTHTPCGNVCCPK